MNYYYSDGVILAMWDVGRVYLEFDGVHGAIIDRVVQHLRLCGNDPTPWDEWTGDTPNRVNSCPNPC